MENKDAFAWRGCYGAAWLHRDLDLQVGYRNSAQHATAGVNACSKPMQDRARLMQCQPKRG